MKNYLEWIGQLATQARKYVSIALLWASWIFGIFSCSTSGNNSKLDKTAEITWYVIIPNDDGVLWQAREKAQELWLVDERKWDTVNFRDLPFDVDGMPIDSWKIVTIVDEISFEDLNWNGKMDRWEFVSEETKIHDGSTPIDETREATQKPSRNKRLQEDENKEYKTQTNPREIRVTWVSKNEKPSRKTRSRRTNKKNAPQKKTEKKAPSRKLN